jgi:surface antigen
VEDEPVLTSPCYTTENHYHNEGAGGQCTWFALGRTIEKGFQLPFDKLQDGSPWHGNAADWANHLRSLPQGTEPKPDSLAVWPGPTKLGHVAYVEDVKDGTVYFREANIEPCHEDTLMGGGYCGATKTGPGLKKRPVASFLSRVTLDGKRPIPFGKPVFVYLQPAPAPPGTHQERAFRAGSN